MTLPFITGKKGDQFTNVLHQWRAAIQAMIDSGGDGPAYTEGNGIDISITNEISVDMKDEDDMASNSATHPPTQQSTKAYVDEKIKDEDDMASNSAAHVPTQQSVVVYVGNASLLNITPNADNLIWQEGTSFASMADGTYVADVTKYHKSGIMVHTGSQSTDVPTVATFGRKSLYSIKIDCIAADTSITSTNYCYLSRFIEGQDFLRLAERNFRFRWALKLPATGVYCVVARNKGKDRSFVTEISATANTWQVHEIDLSASPSAGTWGNFLDEAGLEISIVLAAGSTYQTTPGAWQSGNYLATSNQVNGCASSSYNAYIGPIMFGLADVWFDGPNPQQALAGVQRYYWENDATEAIYVPSLYDQSGAGLRSVNVWFPVEMRVAPTVSYGYAGFSGAPTALVKKDRLRLTGTASSSTSSSSLNTLTADSRF